MRIPAALAAVTALTLGLGSTAAIGLTAAADPPPSWTVDITSDPLLPDGELTFSGTKPSASVPTDVTVTSGETTESATCSGLDTDSFFCSYEPAGGFPAGTGIITFLIGEGADFTVDFEVTAWAIDAPAMSYEYTPAGVIATGSPTPPGSKVAIEFFRYVPEGPVFWDAIGGCPEPGYEGGNLFDAVGAGNTCPISDLAPGIYNPYSQQDRGDGVTSAGTFASDYFVVPEPPTIFASINGDYSAFLYGNLPVGFALDAPDECTDGPYIEADQWSCYTDPLELGAHTFSVQSYDSGGHRNEAISDADAAYQAGGRSAITNTTLTVTTMTPSASLSFAPGSVTVATTPQGLANVARSDLYEYLTYYEYYSYFSWVDDCGGPDPSEGDWDGVRFEGISPELTDFGCTFSELTAGVWSIESQQDDGAGDATGAVDSQFFVVPTTPGIQSAEANDDGTVTVTGTGTYGYPVHVVDGDGAEVCEPVDPDDGNGFSCTTDPLPAGDQTLRAYSVDTGEGQYLLESNPSDLYVTGGTSPLSEAVSVNVSPRLPAMSYQFVPGGVIIDGVPQGAGTVVRTEIWSWTPGGGGGGGFDYLTNCGGPDSGDGGDGESSPFLGITPGPMHCLSPVLSPGVWNVYSEQDTGDGQTPEDRWVDDYFVVPAAPTISAATVDSLGIVTVSGTTVPGNRVYVLNGSIQIVCTAVATETGSWSCATPVLANGGYTLRAYSEDLLNGYVPSENYVTGGLSSLSAGRDVSVAIAALPGTGGTTPPAPTLITPNWFFSLGGVDLSNLRPGDKFTITGSGLPAGSKVDAELHSTPMALGTTTVRSDGTFVLSAVVPEAVEPGDHTVVVTVSGPTIETSTKEQPVRVVPASGTAGLSAEGNGTVAEGEVSGEVQSSAEGELSATAPNILTNSMNPIIEVLNDPARIPAAFAAGLVLIIFAILPAHLLNSTIGEQYERFARRMPALRTTPKWYTSLSTSLAKAPALSAVLLMAATGFLFAFADPKFGFNLHSLRLIMALSAALFVIFFVANWITATIMRRVWNVDVVVRLRPLGLILTVVGVIISRVLEFSPGFLVGVVLGLSIASSAAAEHAWKAVLIRASVVTTFGIGSWIIYSSIAEGVDRDPTFLNEVVLEFFVAVATEGIVLLLVELLPLHMLEGERLYRRSKVLWGSVYIVVLVVFILAVVPWEGNWRELGESFWPWFTVVAIFGSVCVAIYLYFRFIADPLDHDQHHDGAGPELEDDQRVAVGNDS